MTTSCSTGPTPRVARPDHRCSTRRGMSSPSTTAGCRATSTARSSTAIRASGSTASWPTWQRRECTRGTDMALWVDGTASTHDETSKRLVSVLSSVLVGRKEIFDELRDVKVDLGEVVQPDEFKAKTFWAGAVLEIRRQGKLKDLIVHVAERNPPLEHELSAFLTMDSSIVPNDAIAPASNWRAFDNPVDARFVGPGLAAPIFDRDDLRKGLTLLRDEGFRSLNITGGTRTGKSFSLLLLQLVCEVDKAPSVLVDIEDWGTDEFGDIELVSSLATQMKATLTYEDVQNVPDPNTRARLLLYKFRDAVEPAVDKPRWIIVDGLDRPKVQATPK